MGRSTSFTLSAGMQGDAEKHTGFTVGNTVTGNGVNVIVSGGSGGLLLSAASSGQDDSFSAVLGNRQNENTIGGLATFWNQLRTNPLLALLVGAVVILVLLALAAVTIMRSRAEMFEHQSNDGERYQKGKQKCSFFNKITFKTSLKLLIL